MLPDALSRQHAAISKAGTIALALICVGAMLVAWQFAWAWRLLLILGFLIASMPVASHMLARAALTEENFSDDDNGMRLLREVDRRY